MPETLAGQHTAAIRSLVATVVPIAGCAALGLFALVLSSTLLPSPKVLLVLLVAIALAGWFLSRSFNRVYTSAQAALLETFAEPAPAAPPRKVESPLLAEADLATVTVAAGAPAAGRMIRELALRTRTGTSIVALERHGQRQINPGPDEELQAGDSVLLLGSPEQLVVARALFTGPPA
ncbi:MAG: TrkA C-terminal domain-containing protein [Lacunisphaera sp.]